MMRQVNELSKHAWDQPRASRQAGSSEVDHDAKIVTAKLEVKLDQSSTRSAHANDFKPPSRDPKELAAPATTDPTKEPDFDPEAVFQEQSDRIEKLIDDFEAMLAKLAETVDQQIRTLDLTHPDEELEATTCQCASMAEQLLRLTRERQLAQASRTPLVDRLV